LTTEGGGNAAFFVGEGFVTEPQVQKERPVAWGTTGLLEPV